MNPSELEWYSRHENIGENPLNIYISELENGVFMVLSDKGARIGTIAIGIPTSSLKNRINISSMPIVFGIKHDLLTRAIAERVALVCQKIVIASTFLSGQSPDLAQRSLQFAEESIREFLSQKSL
ncbi:MAG: hypothetical protein ACTSQI_01255 [Candidatus Helarchaeota archaeon]